MDSLLDPIPTGERPHPLGREREQIQQRLKRLAQVHLDGLKADGEYRAERSLLEEKLAGLVAPSVDAACEAGKLIEELSKLWAPADLAERRKLLMTMLHAVYVDAVEEKRVVTIRPGAAFRPLLEVATAREGSGSVLAHEQTPEDGAVPPENGTPPDSGGAGAAQPCFWWRRGSPQLYDNNPAFLAEERWGAVPVGVVVMRERAAIPSS